MEQAASRRTVARADERTSTSHLRAVTFLAPGIPQVFFEQLCSYLARVLALDVELQIETRTSGPMHGQADPFAGDLADLGFLCSPSYLYLCSRPEPSIELVPAGFVFSDRRAAGAPVYFSEVVVRADHPAACFEDLAGGVWGYNDECSLSGYFSALQRLADLGRGADFFAASVCTGSHHASLEAILSGTIDGAAIDSTVLATSLRADPALATRLRIVESFGPFPIQPVVVRRGPGAPQAGRIARALLALGPQREAEAEALGVAAVARETRAALAHLGFEGFAPIGEAAYADERRALCALGRLSL